MKSSISKRALLAFLCFTLLDSLVQLSPAQEKPPAQPQWLSILVVHVKPEMLTEFQNFQKNETIPALQKGGVKRRSVWQAAVFGEAFEYVFVTPIDSFAQYDGDTPIQKALGKEGAEAYLAKARKLISSVHTYAVLTRPDLSYEREMKEAPKLAVVTQVHVAPGRRVEYENLIKNEVLPVMKQAGVGGFWVSQSIFGGDGTTFVSLTLYDSFAEIGKRSPFVKVLGQEGATKLGQKFTGIITNIGSSIRRYNAELSFPPPGQPPAK